MKYRATIFGGLCAVLLASPSGAAGVVGTGTPGSCTEASFDTALAGGGAVTFDCGGSPVTIPFTATKTITTATDIDGADLVTFSGGGTVKLFDVTGGGLTIENAALVDGHDTVSDIGAAAIDASAAVSLTNVTVSGHHTSNGGCPAIVMSGATLSIANSTISGNVNEAQAAGFAVCGNNTATVTVQNSTFSGNTGGALLISGTATLTNVTIAGNSSTGAGNTGGIQDDGAVTLADTIVAENAGDAGQCLFVGGTLTDGGNNLQYPDSQCGATIPVENPRLGPLANNGGPTETMALLPGSPAVDAGSSGSCLPADQRGVARTDGDGDGTVVCDIGAFEAPANINKVYPSVPALGGAGLALLGLGLGAAGAIAASRRA
jgi:hypothetical protein